ncbi:MAG: 3-deoxy-8-phosphooctulonate synthase [Candidatus Caenarcaniphilales bacterium]|nr:3-deoxy-8-phosphooctulonate synthase [Candidatus Caenarcaniphilales bacterium]
MSDLLPRKLSDFRMPTRNVSDFLVIAGPCVIESEEIIYKIAAEMKSICEELGLAYVFKASFDKANRTSLTSFRGPGLTEGLRLLKQLKEDLGLMVTSDIHSIEQVEATAEVLDIIQIPAFLCRQTDLLVEAARTGRVVNVKKGQFLAPQDVKYIARKLSGSGNSSILITERGSSFGYHNLVVDFRSIQIIQEELGLPLMFDATHSVQLPGAGDGVSAGNGIYAPNLACAAIACGAFGLWMETHPNPSQALSDGPNMIPLDQIKPLLKRAKAIREACLSNQI